MLQYIYTAPNSIPKELCDDIISYYYEEGDNRYTGVTFSGVNPKIKDTLDFIIPVNVPITSKWFKINNFLNKELSTHLRKYMNHVTKNNEYELFDTNYFTETSFMIQRYLQNKGKYIYHHDFSIDFHEKKHRVITYLWYLNDVEEGGETELWGGEYKIKPEKGKLLLFPADWSFPHRGNMPISNNKYIITGWLYKKY